MADKYISDLTATTALTGTDELELDNGTNSRKITATNAAKSLQTLAFRGALVKKAADQTGANYTAGSNVAWDAEDYDTDAFHDNVTNNSRLTIPSGVTRVRVSAGLEITSLTADLYIVSTIQKNGSSSYNGAPRCYEESGNTIAGVNLCSAVITVTAGDYFELFLQIETDTSVSLTAARCWFAIEVVG